MKCMSNGIFGLDERDHKPAPVLDKNAAIETWRHYSDSRADKEQTVFGSARKGLFYNYDDRLFGDKWIAGLELAKQQATPSTARFYEIALSHFHDAPVDLQHIILGVNRSNGYSCLVFGYVVGAKSAEPCEVHPHPGQ